ncbi:hypothetical protein C7974DRAFT_214211 [Boeremia exigua]|uniref:uncharacterized protein n=1 Tax=Boeremia exigua TaxID=749465 RepID=UPI001E8EA073|nr:uncharacterized protein C7974DRAFT_214211 [Boeremia exigua]KAH6621976.1 hypothetical protein C7974DRAFT_214211 [Boeremia exigua]
MQEGNFTSPLPLAARGSQDQDDYNDARARENLETKLAKVPLRTLPHHRDVHDYYTKNEAKLRVANVPDDLQLDFFLRNYNEIAAGNFKASSLKSLQVNRAIWYYQLSEQHSFSNHFDVVRINICIMAFLFVVRISHGGNIDGYCDDSGQSFFILYLRGWLPMHWGGDQTAPDSLIKYWQDSGLDLIRFKSKPLVKAKAAISSMSQMVPEMSHLEAENLIADLRSGKISEDIFEREGPMLALHWIFTFMKSSKDKMEKEKDDVTRGVEHGLAGDEDETMEEVDDFDLSTVSWHESPVSDLLVDIVPGIEDRPLPTEGVEQRQPWMDPTKALEILQMVKQDHLTELMARSSITKA